MNPELRVGVAGLGTVGAALVRQVQTKAAAIAGRVGRGVRIAGVSARDRSRDRGLDMAGVAWFDDPQALAAWDGIDVFVELIGGDSGPAEASVRAALAAGRHVVTANKALLARHGVELARLAEQAGVGLCFEAAVAGGIPVVKTMREALAGNEVTRIYGILNGTCNYILTRMEQDGLDFAACLAEAQRLGYAEADPSFDIGGNDTAHKLALLTSLAFGCEIDAEAIYLEGIASISRADIEAADELGYRIKLLGVAQRTDTGIEQRVHPTMVPKASAIARIDGVLNAVAIDGDVVGEVVLVGPGAGGNATASSVLSDLADLARGHVVPTLGRPVVGLAPYAAAGMRMHEGGYYIRLAVYDRPGAFAEIARIMAAEGISLESIVQRDRSRARHGEAGAPQPVILITYETTEAAVKRALVTITEQNVIAGTPQMIRIEKLA